MFWSPEWTSEHFRPSKTGWRLVQNCVCNPERAPLGASSRSGNTQELRLDQLTIRDSQLTAADGMTW